MRAPATPHTTPLRDKENTLADYYTARHTAAVSLCMLPFVRCSAQRWLHAANTIPVLRERYGMRVDSSPKLSQTYMMMLAIGGSIRCGFSLTVQLQPYLTSLQVKPIQPSASAPVIINTIMERLRRARCTVKRLTLIEFTPGYHASQTVLMRFIC